MIEWLILGAAGALAVFAAAGEAKELHGEYQRDQEKRRREEEQLAWEAREAELARIERQEIDVQQRLRLLVDQGGSQINVHMAEQELQDLHMRRMMLEAKDLPNP